MKVHCLCLTGLLAAVAVAAQAVPSEKAAKKVADDGVSSAIVYGNEELRYDRPAGDWFDALPIGNGRLGAMAFGGSDQERLTLNEDTIWTGGPLAGDNGGIRREQIEQARALVFAGKANEAIKVLPANYPYTAKYQPFGTLYVNSVLPKGVSTNYVHTLSLDDAIVRTSFQRGGITYSRETFASFTHNVIAYHLTADQKGAISFEATLKSALGCKCVTEGNLIVVRGQTGKAPRARKAALSYVGCATVRIDGGTVTVEDGKIVVAQANAATIFVAIATNYKDFRTLAGDPGKRCREQLAAALKVPYAEARKAHVAFYRALDQRCTLTLGQLKDPKMTTSARLHTFQQTNDPTFAALAFRYGRYLLITSSQPGTQPSNLQGIWNRDLDPAWRSNWTSNINIQMNYWPAEVTGLGDLAEPIWHICDDLAVTGADIARKVYGAKGWVTHHNTDPWRVASLCGPQRCCFWPTGGSWMVLHIWEHWLYTHDREFLARHYETLKGAADFLADILVRDPTTGNLTVCPSISPENVPKYKKHAPWFATGASMDHQLARDLLTAAAEATTILGGDQAYAQHLRDVVAKVEPLKIGSWGQLQEWTQDFDTKTDHCGHTSHLFALYPSNQITPETPALFEAARTSLAARGDSRAWPAAWHICMWARLQDGERAYSSFRNVMTPSIPKGARRAQVGLRENLFNVCPWAFQIDANLGWTAGIAEMLMQSHRGAIDLLPALPKAWPQGEVNGLCARGGFKVDIEWKAGRLVQAKITSSLGEPCTVRYAGKSVRLALKQGESRILGPNDGCWTK